MLALARYTLKGPFQAAGVVGLFAVLAVFIVPFAGQSVVTLLLTLATNLMAVVLVGLIILTQGPGSGLKVIASSALAASLAAWLLLKSPAPGISMVVLQWLPVILLAQTLRSTNSLAVTMFAGVLVGVVVIALQGIYWSNMESAWFSQLLSREDAAKLSDEERRQIAQVVRVLMVLLASSLYFMYMMVILLARWMQARLVDSQGFKREFCALTLGKPAALVAVITISLSLWLKQAWLVSFAALFVIAFMFQGIAVVHSWLSPKKQSFAMLFLYYVLLVFTWQITGILTSITGIIDNWLGFRGKPQTPAS